MVTHFNVPVSDEYGHFNLNYYVLSTALENHMEAITRQLKERPDNESLIEEQRTCMLLSIELVITDANAYLKHENQTGYNAAG